VNAHNVKHWPTINVAGLELRIPPSWSHRHLGVHCVRAGPGVLVSNLDAGAFKRAAPLRHGGCTTRWDVQGVPSTFVLVDLSQFDYPIAPMQRTYSALPPKLEQSLGASTSCGCSFRFADLWISGVGYNLRAWVGSDAQQPVSRALDAMISSIRPLDASQ
jgi:hypothetical protein